MKNVTITLEEDVAKWVRIRAAELETSVSRLVGELLKQSMLKERDFDFAKSRFLGVDPRPLKHSGTYPSRAELHEC